MGDDSSQGQMESTLSSIVGNSTIKDVVNSTVVQEYLMRALGPRQVSWNTLLPITIVYSVIFVTGIVGNLSTCIVIVQNPHMHTATNYYLFSLAVSDVLTLLFGLPNDLAVYWRQYPYAFGSAFCSIRALVSEMTSNASVLTIVAFTLERYLAICHPLYKHKMSNALLRVLKIIFILWLIAFASALPFAALTSIQYIFLDTDGIPRRLDESAFCNMSINNQSLNALLLVASSFIFFIVPMIFIVILYLRIGFKLRRSTSYKISYGPSINGAGGGTPRKFSLINGTRQQQNQLSSSRKILKLLVCVVIVFFMCWAPFHAQRLMFTYGSHMGWTENLRMFNEKLYYIAGHSCKPVDG